MNFIEPAHFEIFGQLALAVLLGSFIGIERTLAHRIAGFRTFAMVAMGACLFTIIGDLLVKTSGASVDPTHIAGQIITGIGFLAGGSIIFNKEHLQGLTTSAGLWVAAAIGVAVGFKFYDIAVFVTILALLIFGLFWQFEKRMLLRKHDESR